MKQNLTGLIIAVDFDGTCVTHEYPKVYANLYIDDAALGAPLTGDVNYSSRPFIHWDGVIEMIVEKFSYT